MVSSCSSSPCSYSIPSYRTALKVQWPSALLLVTAQHSSDGVRISPCLLSFPLHSHFGADVSLDLLPITGPQHFTGVLDMLLLVPSLPSEVKLWYTRWTLSPFFLIHITMLEYTTRVIFWGCFTLFFSYALSFILTAWEFSCFTAYILFYISSPNSWGRTLICIYHTLQPVPSLYW